LILVGPSGVGKSTIRELVAARLDAESLGPDDFPAGWREVNRRLDRAEVAVVEACRIPDSVGRRVLDRGGLVVRLTAPRRVREQRLRDRGESETTIQRRLGESTAITYSVRLPVARTISLAESAPERVSAQVAALLSRA
jgi:ribose 1,5-bisphosphokinase PhnN